MRRAAAIALVLAAPLAVPARAAADTEGCISHPEVDLIDVGMSPQTVRNIADIPGHYGPETDSQYSIEFRSCWAPGERSERVWFDSIDGLSRRWLAVDA